MNDAFSALGRRSIDPPISWLMRLALDHPRLISLAAGFTDNPSLPVDEVRSAALRLFKSPKRARRALQYGSTAGDVRLREFTAAEIQTRDCGRRADAVYDPGRMIITHGSQQFLYAVLEALCDPGDLILVEDPSYFVFLSICQSHGIRCRGLRLEADGIDLGQLERTLEALKRSGELSRVKLLYLVTYFQNPSSVTTCFEKKQAALALLRRYEKAAGHPIYLVEDAAYRDLRFEGEDVPSALGAGRSEERVVYSGTYSKPFASGLRLGFGLLPKSLLPVVLRIKGNHDFGTAHFLQQLLLEAIQSGDYARHLPVLRRRYARKAGVMNRAMKRHLPGSMEWAVPRGGLYFWVRTPGSLRTGSRSKLFKQALAQDLLYVPGEICYAADETRPIPDCEMRLSFGGASPADIREGIQRLGAVLHRLID